MRIEKCIEDGGKKITVYVEDDTVRATNYEAVEALVRTAEVVMEYVQVARLAVCRR